MKKLSIRRPVKPVELPGGDTVHVRSVTFAEMRYVDAAVHDEPDAGERAILQGQLIAAFALANPDGSPVFDLKPGASFDEGAVAAAVAEVNDELTPEQINAVFAAAIPSKDHAKKA